MGFSGKFIKIKTAAFIGGLGLAFVLPIASYAACTVYEDACGDDGTGYFCTNGRTEKICPDGYTISGSTCSHSNTYGSDGTGSYTIIYESCYAYVTDCGSWSSTGELDSDGAQMCQQCPNEAGEDDTPH